MHFTPSFSFRRRVLAVSTLGFALAAAAGCSSSVDQTEAAASPGTIAQADHGALSHSVFLQAVSAVSLRPDQQQKVAAIRAGLEEQAAPVRAARPQLGAELATQVRAGKIDQTRLQPLVDQLAAAAGKTKPAAQQAVQQIHDALDASQRQALVAALHEKVSAGTSPGAIRDHLQKLAATLNLSDEQRATIRAQVHGELAGRGEAMRAEHGANKARMQAIAAAFPGDAFDAKALDVGEQVLGSARRLSALTSVFLEATVPVLTAAQREILATKIVDRTELAEE